MKRVGRDVWGITLLELLIVLGLVVFLGAGLGYCFVENAHRLSLRQARRSVEQMIREAQHLAQSQAGHTLNAPMGVRLRIEANLSEVCDYWGTFDIVVGHGSSWDRVPGVSYRLPKGITFCSQGRGAIPASRGYFTGASDYYYEWKSSGQLVEASAAIILGTEASEYVEIKL